MAVGSEVWPELASKCVCTLLGQSNLQIHLLRLRTILVGWC